MNTFELVSKTLWDDVWWHVWDRAMDVDDDVEVIYDNLLIHIGNKGINDHIWQEIYDDDVWDAM